MDYQTLDAIADTYNPLVFLLCLALLASLAIKHQNTFATIIKGLEAIVMTLVLIYGLSAADSAWSIWPRQGLDYSTHTAFAFGFIVLNCWLVEKHGNTGSLAKLNLRRVIQICLALSFVAYLLLMRYQNYHSYTDMFTTMAAQLLCLASAWLLYWLARRKFQRLSRIKS